MILMRVANGGDVLGSVPAFSDGIHAVGHVTGRIDPDSLLIQPGVPADLSSHSDAEALRLDGDAIVLRVENGCLRWVCPDLSGIRDVFYARLDDGSWCLCDDFLEIARELGRGTPNPSAIRYFISHGYFCNGESYLTEIRRVRAGTRLCFGAGGGPVEENVFHACEPERWHHRLNAPAFREILDSVFEARGMDDQHAILLSGGCDSGIIAAIAVQKLGKHPMALTHHYAQAMDGNQSDVAISQRVAAHFGLAHHVVPVDFDALRLSDLDGMVDRMPMAAHFTLNFLESLRGAARAGATTVWCGQNADSIYNLGPTARLAKGTGKGDLIKRFFLSAEFHRTLPDVAPSAWNRPFVRFAAKQALRFAEYRYREPFTLPENFRELLCAFREAQHYLALKRTGAPSQSEFSPPITTREARELLFEEKLSSFLVGRDARCVVNGAGLLGLGAVRPFAAPSLMMFFRSLEQTWRDTVWPKRYLYRYHKDLLGPRAYAELYGHRPRTRAPKSETWQAYLCGESAIGRTLKDVVGETAGAYGISVADAKLQPLVSLYWLDRIGRQLLGAGIPIR